MIAYSIIDAARSADLVDLVEDRGIKLFKKGGEFVGLCPFHSERTPSFTVNQAKGVYYCFGCRATGNAIDFVMQHERVPFHEAVQSIIGNVQADSAMPVQRQSKKVAVSDEWVPVMPVPLGSEAAPPSTWFKEIDGAWRKLESKRRWAYNDAAGRLLGYVHRFEWTKSDNEIAKDVIQQTYCRHSKSGELSWRWKSFPKPRPIYGLNKLALYPTAQVLIVEGEKACDAAQELFLAAGISLDKLIVVSWPGGGKAVRYVDWSPLHGRKIGLWPDADQKRYKEPHPNAGELIPFIEQLGTIAMLDVYAHLAEYCQTVKFFLPPSAGIPDGWDLADELPAAFDLLVHLKSHAMIASNVRKRFSLTPSIDLDGKIRPIWLVPSAEPTDIRRAEFAVNVLAMHDQRIAQRIDPRGVMLMPYDDLDDFRATIREVQKFLPEARLHALISYELGDEAVKAAHDGGASVEVLQRGESWVANLWEQTGVKGPSFEDLDHIDLDGDVELAEQALTAGIEASTLSEVCPPHEARLILPHKTQAIENSDDALAMQFVECAGDFRWSPGLGWMVDNGVIWARDDAMNRFDLARRVCRAAAATCAVKAEAEAKRISSAKTVAATLTLAQSDRRIVVPTCMWDADPLLLNTPSGIVDLRTGTMRERGIEYVTQATMVAPNFSAQCPMWLRFLHQVFLGDAAMIEFIQRSMGYWLSGSVREQVIHFLYGQGSNGKSVLSDLVKWIIGSYGVKLTATALMQSKGERHPAELAQLRGRRLAMSSELGEHDYFNEALLKELTGDATLSARFMRENFFEFKQTQKHLIVGNFKPRLRGGDPAIARRMLLVPFSATFKGTAKDMSLPEKLKAEAPAILAWMIRGAVKWHIEGLAIPSSVLDASADYMADNDDMAQWIAECCEMEGEARAGDLYASFSAWKKARGENAPSQTVWGSRLTAMQGITKRRSGGIRYSGIRLAASQFEHQQHGRDYGY